MDRSKVQASKRPKVKRRKPGGGRKPGKYGRKIQVSVRLSPDILEWLETLDSKPQVEARAVASIRSRGDHLEAVVRLSDSFKKFVAAKSVNATSQVPAVASGFPETKPGAQDVGFRFPFGN